MIRKWGWGNTDGVEGVERMSRYFMMKRCVSSTNAQPGDSPCVQATIRHFFMG